MPCPEQFFSQYTALTDVTDTGEGHNKVESKEDKAWGKRCEGEATHSANSPCQSTAARTCTGPSSRRRRRGPSSRLRTALRVAKPFNDNRLDKVRSFSPPSTLPHNECQQANGTALANQGQVAAAAAAGGASRQTKRGQVRIGALTLVAEAACPAIVANAHSVLARAVAAAVATDAKALLGDDAAPPVCAPHPRPGDSGAPPPAPQGRRTRPSCQNPQ